jgi:hypothetical protein
MSFAGTGSNSLNGFEADSTLTVLEATLYANGCTFTGAVDTNHASAILVMDGCGLGSTLTQTLGTAGMFGGQILGAASFTGTGEARLDGVNLVSTLTILEATVIVDGSSITGAVLLNHANAVGRFNGAYLVSTYTVTLGQADFVGGEIEGAVSLAGTNANYFSGARLGDAMTMLEATGHFSGCSIDGAVLINHAAAIAEFEGCVLGSTYTVTLGVAQFAGGKITGAVSITGTGTNFISGSKLDGALTCLEATLIVSGCAIVGAIDANHASAILILEGSDGASTLDITLGAGTLIGCRIVGAVGIVGTLAMSASSSTGTITGTPTYFEDARYGEALRDIGGAGIAMINFTGVPAVDDAFTVNGRTHIFDPSGGSDVAITRVGGNVDGTLDNAVTAINADAAGAGVIYAYKATGAAAGHGVLFLIAEAAGTNFALVVTVNVGAAMTAGVANSVGDHAAAFRSSYAFEYTLTAQDILALAAGDGIIIAGIPSTTAPEIASVLARDSGGAILPLNTYDLNIVQVGGAFYAIELVDSAGAAVFLATDTIMISALV